MKRFYFLLFFISVTSYAQRTPSTFRIYPQISLVEMRILDVISNLYEVKTKRAFVLKTSKGNRILKPVIYMRPHGTFKYYWVKVIEDNAGATITHFNFYVDENSREVKYFDSITGNVLSLQQWRKNRK
jgi:hypothetical protein